MKILLVEDDAFFAQRLKEYLADNGIEASTVRTAHDAMSADLNQYCCALIDVMLPNDPNVSGITSEEARGGYLTGVAITRRYRSSDPKFPIVLLSSDIMGGEASRWAKDNAIPYVFKYEDRGRLLSVLNDLGVVTAVDRPRVFIVHGHDTYLLAELKDYLQNTLGLPEPVVLREQPSSGKTIIEKFEEHAGLIDWVFVLLTPDDVGFDPKTNEQKRRARQNVIFELGFFYALLGRREGRVIVLRKGDVELPSDIAGVVWLDASQGVRACGEDIRRELHC